MRVRTPRFRAGLTAATAVLAMIGGTALLAGSTAAPATASAESAESRAKEGHVTGDAWVSFSIDEGNPLRRFIFDAHGNPYKFVDGKMIMGDARGTVRFNHPTPGADGVMQDNWGTADVDYVMTSGPVALVSATSRGGHGWPKGARMSFSVYDDPRGDRFDRVGFSWGVVDGQCHRMGMGPAPFTTYSSGRGYVVKSAPLPAVPANAQGPGEPPACIPV